MVIHVSVGRVYVVSHIIAHCANASRGLSVTAEFVLFLSGNQSTL